MTGGGPSEPKYRQVYNALREQIASGTLGAGYRLPSEADLVRTFGASRITVGRALRDLQQEGLIDRRAGSGSYVRAFQPHPAARLSFGFLVPDRADTEILDAIVRSVTTAPAARDHAFYADGGQADLSAEQKEQAAQDRCRQYIERRVSGVFFAPLELTPRRDAVNAWITAALRAAGIPVVLLDRSVVAYGGQERDDLVGIDNRRAGYRITEHLLQLGARRIAFVGFANAAPTVDARRAGYREALHRYGASADADLSIDLEGDAGRCLRLMEHARPDGIVCANDRTAGLVMHALLRAGYAIPDAVRIAGIDDVHYAALLPVPLTTLRQPCGEIGNAAMAAMLERISRPALPPRDIFVHTALVVRASCGAARQGAGAATARDWQAG